jgi:hypothetical protein
VRREREKGSQVSAKRLRQVPISCSEERVCVLRDELSDWASEIVEKMVPASSFYRHKEGRSTCTERSKVIVSSPNRGYAVDDYCRKYTMVQ